MLPRIATLLFCLSFVTALASAQDEVFLSLTRKAEPLKDLPTNVSVVTQDQIMKKGARNLDEALQNETGVAITSYGTLGQSSNAMFRGASSEQTLVLIDGRRINSIALGSANLSTIPVENIEKIEIIRGAASAVYGTGAFGGVINVITKKPKPNAPLLSLDASAGSFNTRNYRLNFGVMRGQTYGIVTAQRSTVDGWRANSDARNNDFFARIGHDAGTLGTFDLSGSFFRGDLGVPGIAYKNPLTFTPLGPSDFNGELEKKASAPDARETDARDYVKLEHAKSFRTGSLKTSLYASRDVRTYNDPLRSTDNEYRENVFGSELQYAMQNGITAGAEWWEEMYLQKDLLAGADKVDRSRVNTAGFLQHEFTAGAFSFIPSLRFDQNSVFGGVASPRASIIYRAREDLKLSANSGKTWRAPTFNELFYPLDSWGMHGNQDLVPEDGISSDIGVEYADQVFKGSLTFFLTDTRNLIQWGMISPENIGQTRQTGAELSATRKIMNGMYGTLNYTYLWAEDSQRHTQLIYRPMHTANGELSYVLPFGMRASAGARFVGDQRTGNAKVPDLPSYVLVNAGIQQRISDFELWLRAENLLNTNYETRLGYPLPGLTLQTGLTLRFWE